jgi:hypothetical protein
MNLFTIGKSYSWGAGNLRSAICGVLVAVALAVTMCFPALAAPSGLLLDPIVRNYPTWHLPQVAEVKAQASDWVRTNCKEDAARAEALSLIADIANNADGTELLDSLAEAFAVADPGAAQVVDLCSRSRARAELPGFAWMTEPNAAPIMAANLRLYFGRWLVQEAWFEEALDQIGNLNPADVAAPAELLFYQSVAYYCLLNKEQGLKTLDRLLDGAEFAPRRYVDVAMLMKYDLETLKEGTLKHIARQMDGNGRWLDKGRAGPKVRKAEDRIIESLDRLIREYEGPPPDLPVPGDLPPGPGKDPQPGPPGPSGKPQPSRPAQDSTPMAGKGPGGIDKREFGHKSGWGNLPPKQREEALQQMGKDFPPHYREAIEQYFRKLATEKNDDEDK